MLKAERLKSKDGAELRGAWPGDAEPDLCTGRCYTAHAANAAFLCCMAKGTLIWIKHEEEARTVRAQRKPVCMTLASKPCMTQACNSG